jgi:hypothetical protein
LYPERKALHRVCFVGSAGPVRISVYPVLVAGGTLSEYGKLYLTLADREVPAHDGARRRPAVKSFFALFLLAAGCRMALGQASPTATRLADLQIGGSYSYANPDDATVNQMLNPNAGSVNLNGYGLYADLDLKYHLGLELDFHQLSGIDPILYERSYEVGPRFIWPIHERFVPYAKAMYGRGVFNFPGKGNSNAVEVQVANLAYNIYTFGGGIDLRILPGLNVRIADVEVQRWENFPVKNITPMVFSFGVAYHFHGSDRYGK